MFKTYQKICNRTAILLVFFLLLFMGAAESVPDRLMQKKQNITTQETVIKREIQAGVVLDLRERLFDTGIISKELEVVYLTPEEEERMEVTDFGLNDPYHEGLMLHVYVNTKRCCAKELPMLPGQNFLSVPSELSVPPVSYKWIYLPC